MNHPKSIELTVSEIGYLWCGYTINEMSRWFLTIFEQKVSDPEIKAVCTYALSIATELIKKRENYLLEAGFPIPLGFSDSDINKQAPPLFTDKFILHYLDVGAKLGLTFHSNALATSTRADVRDYMADCLHVTVQLHNRIVDLLLTKGMYWRTPPLPSPDTQEKMKKISYLNGWFGDTRPSNSMEIANLYATMELLTIIEALSIGFAQTSEVAKVREMIQQGYKVAENQFNLLAQILTKDKLPVPPTYIGEVTDSNVSSFSDRLMISHIAGIFGSLITLTGSSQGSVMEHDLILAYSALNLEAGGFAQKNTKYMIEQEWLEKVPGAVDRATLINS